MVNVYRGVIYGSECKAAGRANMLIKKSAGIIVRRSAYITVSHGMPGKFFTSKTATEDRTTIRLLRSLKFYKKREPGLGRANTFLYPQQIMQEWLVKKSWQRIHCQRGIEGWRIVARLQYFFNKTFYFRRLMHHVIFNACLRRS